MKILYDHQVFEMQKVGGISRYFCEIIERGGSSEGIEIHLTLKYSQNEYLRQSGLRSKAAENPDSYENFLGGREFKGKWALYKHRTNLRKPIDASAENVRMSLEALQRQDFDVFHPTYYDDYFLPHLGNKPFVLTVYDMIHELYPEYFNLADLTSQRKRNLARRAARIIAISECTKRDLIDFFAIPEEKIKVIHLANSLETADAGVARFEKLANRFLLFVGSRTIYKNFYFFINAVIPVLAAEPTLHVVCAGSPFDKNEKVFLQLHGITDRVHTYTVNDAELGVLYRRALAFIFPSLYEGFGLPVLEAFQAGCPVILCNAGSLPEVGGDAAVYFEQKNALSLRKAVVDVLSGDERRRDIVERGRQRLAAFSWDRTLRETHSLYRQLLPS